MRAVLLTASTWSVESLSHSWKRIFMLEILATGVLIAVVALATRWDLLERRIPNALCVPALLAGVTLNVLSGGVHGLWLALSGAATGLAVLLPFYLRRGMGAGDVKLMAAIGSFLGPLGALLAAAATLFLGALLAIGLIVYRRYFTPKDRVSALLSESPPLADTSLSSIRKERFPYAVAIAGGTLVLMWQRGQLDLLADALLGGAL